MMKAGDLRTGNWVRYMSGDEAYYLYRCVSEVLLHGIIASAQLIGYDRLAPIPLTEEILNLIPELQKSRNNDGTTYHVKKNRWEVKWTIEHWTEIEKESEYYGMFFIHGYGGIKYLHELQNYYYLFEKQDLTIKL